MYPLQTLFNKLNCSHCVCVHGPVKSPHLSLCGVRQ